MTLQIIIIILLTTLPAVFRRFATALTARIVHVYRARRTNVFIFELEIIAFVINVYLKDIDATINNIIYVFCVDSKQFFVLETAGISDIVFSLKISPRQTVM